MALETMALTPAMAQNLIGRLGWTAGLSVGKIGKAYTKALWAQCEDPMHGKRVSVWLQLTLKWWLSFFKLQVEMWRTTQDKLRRHQISWTDACGTLHLGYDLGR